MKVTLYIKDRLWISFLFARHEGPGKFLERMNVAHMEKMISITPEDHVKFKMQDRADGNVVWDAVLDKGTEYEFTEPQIEIIRNMIKSIPRDAEINTDEAKAYLKFIDIKDIQP